jgi:hypothetical protein
LFDSNTYFLINFNPKHLEKKMPKLFDKPTDSLNKQKKKKHKNYKQKFFPSLDLFFRQFQGEKTFK